MHQASNAGSPHLIRYSPVFLLLLCLWLSGCASPPHRAAGSASERSYHSNIQISGRILVRYQQNGKPQSLPGSFEWQQTPDSLTIALLSQLGQTIATINQTASGASLQQAGQETRYASDLDSLLTESLGWSLPVSGLRDWLQAYSRNPQGQRTALAAQDNIEIDTDGWHLRYATWEAGADSPRPKRIDLQRSTVQAGELSLRIAIDQWTPQ
ncbi:lipoprotein insertase outer membrane protein LolB [Undibacterium sp. Jales W-56]|uniref:lipoprotein insertase outer membrane protein LolB n=1 Tax=Undibacterium sp. Jales W-56 TaxID=2897325 RepID=UPI0021D3E754|nr:lipoprotein insertase outer membrane protein LolB [Undibacterium sp. Jales W-56]MCU6432254.1 lipoprotein insertase outer membrane protein LolB [Undibacterium sp. Jales W-56]